MTFRFKGGFNSTKPAVRFSGGSGGGNQPKPPSYANAPAQPQKPIQLPSWLTRWANQQQARPQQPASVGNISAPPPQGPTAANDYTNPARGYQGTPPSIQMPKPSTLPPFFQNWNPDPNGQSALTSTVPGTYASGYAAMGEQAKQARARAADAARYQGQAAQYNQQRANAADAARYQGQAAQYNQQRSNQAWADRYAKTPEAKQYAANYAWGQRYQQFGEEYQQKQRILQAWADRLTGQAAEYFARLPKPAAPSSPGYGGGIDYGGGGGGYGPGVPDLPSWYVPMLVWDY